MCLRVFVASDLELDALPLAEVSGAPLVQQPPREGLERVRAMLELPCFVEIGASGSCACGFATDSLGWDGTDLATALSMRDALTEVERDDLSRSQAARDALAAWLDAHRARGARLRLYACWWGGEDGRVETTCALTVDALRGSLRPFEEDVLYEVVGPS